MLRKKRSTEKEYVVSEYFLCVMNAFSVFRFYVKLVQKCDFEFETAGKKFKKKQANN